MHWRALGRTRILGSGFEAHDQSEAFRSCPDKILQILRNQAFVPRRVFRLIFSKSSNLDLEMGFVVHEKSYCFPAKPVWREMSVSNISWTINSTHESLGGEYNRLLNIWIFEHSKHFLADKLKTWVKRWIQQVVGCPAVKAATGMKGPWFWVHAHNVTFYNEHGQGLIHMHTMLHFTTHRVWF